MLIERIVYFAISILATFALGFIIGNACATSKYVRRQRGLTRQVRVLETWKKAVKVLCPKIQDGEDIEIKADRLPQKLHGIKLPTKEDDDDTKTAELEIVNHGDPRDF